MLSERELRGDSNHKAQRRPSNGPAAYSEGHLTGSAEPDYSKQPEDKRFLDVHLDALHTLDKRILDLLGSATDIADRLVGPRPQPDGEDNKATLPQHGIAGELESRTRHMLVILDALSDELARISRI